MLQTETLSLSGRPLPVGGVTLKLIQRKRGSMELLEMFTMLDRSRWALFTDDRLFLFGGINRSSDWLHSSAPKCTEGCAACFWWS